MERFDVVIIGASIGGCTAATLLARNGLQVALVDRRPDVNAFKRVCGHFVQSSAVPVLERLGVLDEIVAAGAVRGHARVWSRYGWIGDARSGDTPMSLSLRRELLDPLLRRHAIATPGVEPLLGWTLTALRPGQITLQAPGGAERELTTRLIVGADGRGSRTAALAGLRTRASENARCAYWGYFRGAQLGTDASVHLWMLEPDVAIATPTDDDLLLCAAFRTCDHADELRADPEAAVRAFFAELPDGPELDGAARVGPMVGKLDLTSERRPVAGDGVALVGDAALAADPVGAVGCGWALQSAEWLADAVAAEPAISRALRHYARRHRRALNGHAVAVDRSSRSLMMAPPQRLLLRAAVHDPPTAARLEAFAARREGPSTLLKALPRAALIRASPAARRSPTPSPAR
jgi:2-polyprenyl-6-methoxyphenol hydroxylase-like FAD-dependent oxidoreductase